MVGKEQNTYIIEEFRHIFIINLKLLLQEDKGSNRDKFERIFKNKNRTRERISITSVR